MPEASDDIRLQTLQDTADKVEETNYYVPLSHEQLDIKREGLADNAIKLSEIEDELKEIKDDFKLKIDPLKTIHKNLLTEIKTKQEFKSGKLYHLANHESGYMETYDETGILIGTRRLRPDEKQKTVFSISKTA